MGGRREGKVKAGCEVPGFRGMWIMGPLTELRNRGWREILQVAPEILVLRTRSLKCPWDTQVELSTWK